MFIDIKKANSSTVVMRRMVGEVLAYMGGRGLMQISKAVLIPVLFSHLSPPKLPCVPEVAIASHHEDFQ